jgi:hypothetical protein
VAEGLVIRGEFFIPGTLPGWNDLLKWKATSGKGGWNRYNDTKGRKEEAIALYARDMPKFPGPVRIWYEFHEPTKRRDPSNFTGGAIKLIEDALVHQGILQGDGWAHIMGFHVNWRLNKKRPGIQVTILGEETSR